MRYVFLPLLSLLTASNLALAAPEDGGMWTLAVENDALGAKTDKNYTSGLKILYRAPERLTPDFAWGLAQGILGADAQDAVFTTWAIGQSIYTPDDTKTALPLPDQHPYAGWLYGELGIHAQDQHSLTSLTLNLGVVGPSAGAEGLQTWWHDLLGFNSPKGWDNQLDDELGVILSLEKRWQFDTDTMFGFETDLIPMVGISAGNVLTEVQAGITWRIGESLENDWGQVRVRPGNAGPGARSIEGAPSWQVWAGVQARAQAVNIFLDGNTLGNSLSVDKNEVVVDMEIGGAINLWGTIASFTYVVRSEEFDMQDGAQNFGVITLTTRF